MSPIRIRSLSVVLLLVLAPAAIAVDPHARVYVQYHLWYAKADVPLTRGGQTYPWHGWSQNTPYAEVTGGVSPENMVTPWKRVTASRTGLPLIGPYSSISEPGAIAHGFRVAKQAGIDGMFASVLDGAWYPIFNTHLDLAAAAGMPLGQDVYHSPWAFDCTETEANQLARRTSYLGLVLSHTTHANYLRVDGKPVIWIANAPSCGAAGKVFTWGNRAQLAQIIQTARTQTGVDFRLVITGPPLDNAGERFSDIPEVLRIVGAENIFAFWNRFPEPHFTPRSAADRLNFENDVQIAIDHLRAHAGAKAGLHVYPAFDERGLFPTTTRGPQRPVIGRDGNGMYANADGFLKAALDQAAANQLWVFIESWNDWMEQTQLEPAFHSDRFRHHLDPFSALRQVAAFKGAADVAFELPAASLLDPPLRDQCRQKQWGSLTAMRRPTPAVKLRGKFGFKTGAQLSNGVALSISVLPDLGAPWQNAGLLPKTYDGTLKSFEFDLTSVIDAQAVVLGIEAQGNSSYDWAYLTELVLDWYGQPIDLLKSSILSQFAWHSSSGTVTWNDPDPSHGPGGVARLSAVTMEDGLSYTNALYLCPDWVNDGFLHGVVNFPATGAPGRVLLTGRFGFANGATPTNGAALSVLYLEDDRNHPSPQWETHTMLVKPYDGTLRRFAIDITPILDKPAISIGVEGVGSTAYDWVHFTELKLNWYGQSIDLIASGAAGQLAWFSSQGPVLWNDPNPANAPKGTARTTPVTMENGQFYPNALYLHPDWNAHGFVRAGLNPWITNASVTPCP